jgi:hypothetical protein
MVEQQSRDAAAAAAEVSDQVSRASSRVKGAFFMNENKVMFASMLSVKTKDVFPVFYRTLNLRVRRGRNGNPHVGTPRGLGIPQESEGENRAVAKLNVLADIQEEEEEEVEELLDAMPAEPRRLMNISYVDQLCRERAGTELLREKTPGVPITEQMISERAELLRGVVEAELDQKIKKEEKKSRKLKDAPPAEPPLLRRRRTLPLEPESSESPITQPPSSPMPSLRGSLRDGSQDSQGTVLDSQGTVLDSQGTVLDSQGRSRRKRRKTRKPKPSKPTKRMNQNKLSKRKRRRI